MDIHIYVELKQNQNLKKLLAQEKYYVSKKQKTDTKDLFQYVMQMKEILIH